MKRIYVHNWYADDGLLLSVGVAAAAAAIFLITAVLAVRFSVQIYQNDYYMLNILVDFYVSKL